MNLTSRFVRFAATCLVLTLAACGGGGGDGGGTPPAGTVVGSAGGTVLGPNGAKVEIPPGALAADTTIAIEATTAGSPALPGAFSALGQMFALTPHGTTFAVPVTVTLPFDPASVPAGQAAALFKTNAQSQWEPVVGAAFGTATVSAQITSFSWVQVGGLLRNDPVREWEFSTFPGTGLAATSLGGVRTALVGEFVEEIEEFGSQPNDTPVFGVFESRPADGRANGYFLSTANGVTYAVGAQAPDGRLGSTEPIGSLTRFKQKQSYIKLSNTATLTFTLTAVSINTEDFNFPPLDPKALIDAEAVLTVKAYKSQAPETNFYAASSIASLSGHSNSWRPLADGDGLFPRTLWTMADFDFSTRQIVFTPPGGNLSCPGIEAELRLKASRTFSVDLSSVGLLEEFTLEVETSAQTSNRRGGGSPDDCQLSYAHAFLRDPVEVGGTTIEFTGLEPTNRPVASTAAPVLFEPASCVPGPGPNAAAGMLQFAAATFDGDERIGAPPSILITRTGGASGAVTATFRTSDGSAVAGTDYTPVAATVFFADGETGPKLVGVPVLPDSIDEVDKTVILALSQPGGCAAIGPQSTAVLTIRDDDVPASAPSGLDPTFGIGGKATSSAFGGDRSGMALQADGKIVMVGGTFTDFVLARFNADGSPDTSFGVGGGRVITDMGSGLRQEEALAVAIQPDGKIVVVGHTAIDATPPAPDLPPTFAIARYNSDGSLDTSFGIGGRVSGNVNGIARAVAIQSDGKVVLAGEFELQLSNGTFVSDFTVARFNANGSLDLAFGTSGTGQVATDIGGAANSARNLVLQPNGAIVVSGKPQCSQSGCDHTDVVRYNANGTLDTSFGSGGKLTLAGVEVGEGLVRQSDGKLVLAGGVTTATVPATARFVLMRLNADGAIDTSFGNAGTVDTAFTESALANGVALQADGKIVAVGTRAFSANPNFIVARYNANGSVDATFGSDGNLSIDFFGFTDAGESVLVQPDGKIVVGGLARSNVDGYGVARINP